MFQISKDANPNYLGKVVTLSGVKKLENSDFLQTVEIDFQTVVTGLTAQDGDTYVYFPVECKINSEFISHISSFKDTNLNKDKEVKGFFEENCRVKAVRLRGTKSMGFIVPIHEVLTFANVEKVDLSKLHNTEFDTVNGILLLEKYVVKKKQQEGTKDKKVRSPRESRLVENQFKLHVSTDNLRKSVGDIKLNDLISITYKLHGTSAVFGNVLTKRKLNWFERLISKFVPVVKQSYGDIVYSSRNVVKNRDITKKPDQHYYSSDIWGVVKKQIEHLIPKGITLYGEIVGFLPDGGYIQKDYDYGCEPKTHEFYLYRATYTNEDGVSFELSYPQLEQLASKIGIRTPDLFFYGTRKVFCHQNNISFDDNEAFIKKLEFLYNDRDCYMCKNKVPEEGVVVRVEKLMNFEAYKLKSFDFLTKESKQLDSGEADIESDN